MPPMNSARRRAVRAVLGTLAGGGLTAASLGVSLPNMALASGTTKSAEATGETTTTTPSAEGTGTTTTAVPAPPPTTTTTTPAAPPKETSTTPAPVAPAKPPAVVHRRHQHVTKSVKPTRSSNTQTTKAVAKAKAKVQESGANNVALSPQQIAAQTAAIVNSAASIQALGFYRIPLFLLPIYKAAAVQYGVPWQILAAINEIETNYGTDQSVSSAGAVGWMQFMPSTWLQYGVDALNAGYADPYNPVDAIFAAARYLKAAGAAKDLHAAILAYNHSEEYASSVLLRAKLISAYPKSVIATLTGLIDARLPVTGKHVSWSPAPSVPAASASSATAGSVPAGHAAGAPASAPAHRGTAASGAGASTATPGSTPAPSPSAAAAAAASPVAQPMQLVQLTGAATANVVAVQDGRVLALGASRRLGHYLVLRDVYGDVFTYAGLGSVASSYTPTAAPSAKVSSPVVAAAAGKDPAPSTPASAGVQSPLTLPVKTPKAHTPAAGGAASLPAGSDETPPAGMGRVRLFAHPGNPDARAAAAATAAARARAAARLHRVPLRRGSVVGGGTVLGTLSVPAGAHTGHMRFAIRPAGDPATIDPGPILANWAQLQTALHPQGAPAAKSNPLLGATASDVFLLSKGELQRDVLSDPGVTTYACGRHDIASGAIDRRALAVLAFLSRSGLRPTVTGLRCGQSPVTASGAPSAEYLGDAAVISAVDGETVAGHQGAGTVTDLTVRTLLTLPPEFAPASITSLMRYPGSPNTFASRAYWNRIRLAWAPAPKHAAVHPSAGTVTGSGKAAKLAPVPVVTTLTLNSEQWSQLVGRVAGLPEPKIATKPSSAAIPDPKHK
jgi:membrane-bound lytic murein transglycosylase B